MFSHGSNIERSGRTEDCVLTCHGGEGFFVSIVVIHFAGSLGWNGNLKSFVILYIVDMFAVFSGISGLQLFSW